MKDWKAAIPFAGCFAADQESIEAAVLVFVGLPDDSQSSYCRGCSRAPERIRLAYDGNAYNSTTELGVDLSGLVADLGDLSSQKTWDKTAQIYCEFAKSLFRTGKIPFFVGGDHAVTVPIVKALAVLEEPIFVVQLDAHPDLYPEYGGNPDSHACTAARIAEMDHVRSITQIGIRTLNATQAKTAADLAEKINMISAADLSQSMPRMPLLPEHARVYLSVDLDALDPAYAPGVSHPVPGGLTSRQVIQFIQNSDVNWVGMDVVELNPKLDMNDQTAVLAAKLLHEAMGKALSMQLGKAE